MAALLAAAALALTACAGSDDKGEPDDGGDRGASLATTSDADWKPVADILGRTGKLNDGSVYKIGFARSDLSVQTKGVTVAPALSLGSWVAFARTPDGQTMLMGDLVVTEDELASVTDAVQAGGLQQTALHKHLLEQSPPIWWTHIAGHGDAADLARAVRSALDATDTPPPASATSGQTSLDLDTAAIDEALGRSCLDWLPPIHARSGPMYAEHDVVVLTRDVPDKSLIAGDVGAVVGRYAAGGYEVDFTAANGCTVAVVTLAGDDIRPRRRREIPHVREVA